MCGAYGESMSQILLATILGWVNQVVFLAFPHVRGGRRKGRKHGITQGMKFFKIQFLEKILMPVLKPF